MKKCLAILFVGSLLCWSPTVAKASVQFVRQAGTTLTLGGQPYTFAGFNIYMAASGGKCGGPINLPQVLSLLPNGIVFRLWAFQDFYTSTGYFNTSQFDNALSAAAAHGDKIIPVLANQYNYCENQTKTLSWYQSGYQTVVNPGERFSYRQYAAIMAHKYANNPTIAMWQLVNEGEAVNADGTCTESAALPALQGFAATVARVVHNWDPNHLVSLGTLAGWSGGGYQWCGAQNGDYQTLMGTPGIQVCDYHDYGFPTEPLGRPTAPNLTSALQMCNAVGKPLMVGETGIYATDNSQLPARASAFQAKFSAQFQAGSVGELIWCWANSANYVLPPADPDYSVFPGDPSLNVPRAYINPAQVS